MSNSHPTNKHCINHNKVITVINDNKMMITAMNTILINVTMTRATNTGP